MTGSARAVHRSSSHSPRAHQPAVGPPPVTTLPPIVVHRLGNGLDVCIVERHDLPVVDVRFIVRGGASEDPPEHAGHAYMLGDLLDQGTERHSALEIAEQADTLGASLETRASWDSYAAALHVLTPRIEPALQLLADVMLNATVPDAELERGRSERLAAILQERDEPRTIATQAFNRHAYDPAHPYSAPLAGTRESIAAVGRADLMALRRAQFAPASAFLVLTGDIAADAALPLVERLFGGWTAQRTGAGGDGRASMQQRTPGSAARVHIVDRPAAPQSELRVGRPGPARDTDDYFALLVANTVLGGAFTSRLNMRLREEKGYTYGAGSRFAFRAGGGPFMASTAVATAATADAVDVIVTEIERMTDEAVPDAELERAKNYVVLGLPASFETTGNVAEHVVEVALYGLGRDYYGTYADHVRAVSAADVQAASARWLGRAGLTIAIAGDAGSIAPELEALKIGDVNVDEYG
ncbi:MAG: insulinase family protein [Gemmatimonadetes bacterium]|nr:insulinase family protein [Gemmatimonadota bacterium]